MKFLPLANSLMQRVQMALQHLRVKLIELNFFKTRTMLVDPFELITLRISTWVYLIFLCLSMITIVLFTSLSVRIETEIENSTLANFQKLQKQYRTSLQCPCSQIAIPYHSFVSIVPQFHPVCTSWLISDLWIDDMWASYRFSYSLTSKDILRHGPRFFINLKKFCKLMETIVSDASFIFNRSSLISLQVLSYDEFMARAEQILEQFKLNTVAESKRRLALMLSQTVTMYTTGDTDVSWYNSSHLAYYQTVAKEIGSCSCGLMNDDCKEQLILYDYLQSEDDSFKPLLNVSSMFSSCFTVQSLLLSSLECFFNQTCAHPIVKTVRWPENDWDNFPIMKITSTRFPPNMTIREMINEMMINTWDENIDYKGYYEQCAPQVCTYLLKSHNNALYVITTMIGLFGGLSVAFRIIVPSIVKWVRKRIRRRTETDGTTGKQI